MHDQMAPYRAKATAVVITTAMLTFISFWRAAAVVLCDISSTAYYVCGIAEQAIGKAAPWFIALVMVIAYALRSVYIESCAMFVRAGVYRVVKEAMGGTMAKLSVSALIFDYVLTGPISAVCAGTYLVGFVNDILNLFGMEAFAVAPASGSVVFAIVVTLYFWRKNVIGIEESSGKALRIMTVTAIMVAILLLWSVVSLIMDPKPLPPIEPVVMPEAWGWLNNIPWLKAVGLVGILIAIGHSILAMSGEETLAQVYREIAKPKLLNMKRTALVMFIFSFMFTAVVSLLAVMIIPDDARSRYYDNMIAGLVMYLQGPVILRLIFQGVVVLVGAAILSGAVNTAMIGSNSVLCRVAEDGVLAGWFRAPHKRYGTTYRIVTMIAAVQILTIILSWGNIYLLGEAYAFGVIWSFTTQTLAVFMLRFKDKSPREYKVPLNLRIFGREIPIGIGVIFVVLFFIAAANFLTKTVATKWGSAFTVAFFVILVISEIHNKHIRKAQIDKHERVNLRFEGEINPEHCGCRKQNRVVVAVRDPNSLYHLKVTLGRFDPKVTDVVVLTIEKMIVPTSGEVEALPHDDQLLLTNVVAMAEKHGTHVIPLVVPAKDPTFAMAKVAFELGAMEIVVGRSEQVAPEVQLERLAIAWGYLAAETGKRITVRIVWPKHELKYELS